MLEVTGRKQKSRDTWRKFARNELCEPALGSIKMNVVNLQRFFDNIILLVLSMLLNSNVYIYRLSVEIAGFFESSAEVSEHFQ